MHVLTGHAGRPIALGVAIVGTGVIVGITTALALSVVRPVLLAFAFGGLLMLLIPLRVREQRAYWLFLFTFSIPFDVSKRTTTWIVQPWDLYNQYGLPASGTLSIDIYLTDVLLLVMVLSWIPRLCFRRDKLYFPAFGYIFVLYLAYTVFAALLEAESFYLFVFELCRESLYFLSFLYIINNVTSAAQLRAIVLAMYIGLLVGSGSVIAFYGLGIGSATHALSGLYTQDTEVSEPVKGTVAESHTGYVTGHSGSGKRSAGILGHPAHAAYYFEFIIPIVLASMVAATRTRDRLLYAGLLVSGCIGLYLTFSRAGLMGLLLSLVLFFPIARWARLMSQRAFAWSLVLFLTAAAVTAPVLIYSFAARPQTITKRLELDAQALEVISKRPLTGAGLNNSSAAMPGSLREMRTARGTERQTTVVHNYYLLVLIEVGIIGFVLYFAFFGEAVAIALRHMRSVEIEMKVCLVGIVVALGAIGIHNLGDPFGGHIVRAMLWLEVALIVAICRNAELATFAPRSIDTVRQDTH